MGMIYLHWHDAEGPGNVWLHILVPVEAERKNRCHQVTFNWVTMEIDNKSGYLNTEFYKTHMNFIQDHLRIYTVGLDFRV